jgi:nitrogenase-associated protein
MAQITFYTKLGCMTSAKQIDLLQQSGHNVEVCDLLAHPWTTEELTSYFGEMPVTEWFNEKSPRVKSGEIDPTAYGRDEALALMLDDHLLIHRPLMESSGKRLCGFDPAAVHAWIGLTDSSLERSAGEDYAGCSQPSETPQQCEGSAVERHS